VVLLMACPTKRKGSDNWHYRPTIPADVRRILARLPKTNRPRNWYAQHVTPDRAAAKAKCPEVTAQVERQLEALRTGPKTFTPKHIAALSGELYSAFADGLEADRYSHLNSGGASPRAMRIAVSEVRL
jgi:hypothetical protein